MKILLFSQHKDFCFNILIPCFNFLRNKFKFFPHLCRVVLSEKLQISTTFIERSKSIMKILNEIGSYIDPLGTTRIISRHCIYSKKNLFLPSVSFFDRKFWISFRLLLFTLSSYAANLAITLHKKWSFPLRISSVNVTKSAGNCGFGPIYWRNP